ncbi:MAG: porin PorA family protein [Dehalococcoidia bacterium]
MPAQGNSLKGYKKVIFALTGAILIVFGALWMTAIFPSLMKAPTDLDKTQTFVGTVQFADQTGALSEPMPLSQTRHQMGIGTEGDNVLIVEEVITFANAVTGEAIPFMPPATSTITVDRSTLKMVSSETADVERQGQWSPPSGLAEGDSFMVWNPAAGMALEATYVRSDTFQGLDVLVFQINEEFLPLGQEEQQVAPGVMMMFDKYLTTDVTITIEPTTGVPVNTVAHTAIGYALPGMDPVPSFVQDVRYSEATIASYMDTATSARSQLFLFGTLIPWIAIGCGAALLMIPADLVVLRKLRKATVEEPADVPTPTPLPL